MIMPIRLCACASVGAMRMALRAWCSASIQAPLPNNSRPRARVAATLFGSSRTSRASNASDADRLCDARNSERSANPPMCLGDRSRSSMSSLSASTTFPTVRAVRARTSSGDGPSPGECAAQSNAQHRSRLSPLPHWQAARGSSGWADVMPTAPYPFAAWCTRSGPGAPPREHSPACPLRLEFPVANQHAF